MSLFCYRGNLDEIIEKYKGENLKEYEKISNITSDEVFFIINIYIKKPMSLNDRTDMRITFMGGKFFQENLKYLSNKKIKQVNKKKPKNILVTANIIDNDGNKMNV